MMDDTSQGGAPQIVSDSKPKGRFHRLVQQPWFWLVVFAFFSVFGPFHLFSMLFVPISIWFGFWLGRAIASGLSAALYIIGFVLATRYIPRLNSMRTRIFASIGVLFLLATLADLIITHRFQTILLFIDSVFGTTLG
ncbi:MAG: hypothetical protein HY093_00465 [Candidatus Liptonbacteria bacterium]|nr:hypothetical protein [Candidatus Liptonbacteria bacterium]